MTIKHRQIIFLVFILLIFPFISQAHPGRTASDGCHYCRTNCDSWGEVWNARHCHNGGGSSGSSGYEPSFVQPDPEPVYTPPPKPTPEPEIKIDSSASVVEEQQDEGPITDEEWKKIIETSSRQIKETSSEKQVDQNNETNGSGAGTAVFTTAIIIGGLALIRKLRK